MKRFLSLVLAGLFVVTVSGCGGRGGPPPPPPPPPSADYRGGVGYALADQCAYAVSTFATRQTSASFANSQARQSCISTVASQPLPGGGRRPTCSSGSFSECAAVAAGYNISTSRCRIRVERASTYSAAVSSALRNCGNALGSACQTLSATCSASATPAPAVRRLVSGSPPPPPPPPSTLPPEPRRTSPPQGGGSDISGVEVAGAGTTTSVSALNSTSRTLTLQAGTWFEPKDGRYQRMIVSRSTSVPPNQITRIPTACMQRGNPVPATGARFYSRAKSISGSVQQCQLRCLSGSQNVQACVWNCESPSPPPPPPPQPGPSAVSFTIVDQCNDGAGTLWRLHEYSRWLNGDTVAGNSRTGVAPSPPNAFLTPGFGRQDTRSIRCTPGRGVCYGAVRDISNPTRHWGSGIDGDEDCTNCCLQCPTSGTARSTPRGLSCN